MKEGLKFWFGIMGFLLILGITTFIVKGTGEVADVIHSEFGAKSSLSKYEWFIDTSATIDRYSADIDIYTEKQKASCSNPKDRIIREQCMQWSQELAGIKSTYNSMVASYNAASRKFNWSLYDTANLKTTYLNK